MRGRINGSPVNVRVSHWTLNESAIAKEGRAGEWSVLYGDCIVTGVPDGKGDFTAVDPGLVDYFTSLHLDRNAVRDWDVRSVGFTVTTWEIDRDRGNDGPGLGF
jgi:hypothetical protein